MYQSPIIAEKDCAVNAVNLITWVQYMWLAYNVGIDSPFGQLNILKF